MSILATHNNEGKRSSKRASLLAAMAAPKEELYRGFNTIMNFAFTFSAVAVLSGISVLFSNGLATGGPVVMVWGWVLGALMTLVVALCMSEICSTYPQTGSVYYWSGQLAGDRWGPIAAWIAGWFNLIGNASSDASYAMGFGQAVTALTVITGGCAAEGSQTMCGLNNSQTVAVAIAGLFTQACLNFLRVDKLGSYNVFSAFWMMLSSLGIVIVVLVMAPTHQSASFVFTAWNNDTNISNTTYVAMIGLLTALFSFSGYEAGAHMAGETKDATRSAPKGIYTSVIAGIIGGFIYIVCLLFATQNLEGSANSNTGNAAIQIFYDAAGPKVGLALAICLTLTLYMAGISSVTVTSRIAYAMVRDNALPLSNFLRPLNKYTHEPIRLVIATFIFSAILICTSLISTTAFTAVSSITTVGYQISYAIPIFLRCTIARKKFRKGAFHLGSLSIPLAVLSFIWLSFTSILFLLPTTSPITPSSMNYAPIMVVGIAILVMGWWFISARKTFRPGRVVSSRPSDLNKPLLQGEEDEGKPLGDAASSMAPRLSVSFGSNYGSLSSSASSSSESQVYHP